MDYVRLMPVGRLRLELRRRLCKCRTDFSDSHNADIKLGKRTSGNEGQDLSFRFRFSHFGYDVRKLAADPARENSQTKVCGTVTHFFIACGQPTASHCPQPEPLSCAITSIAISLPSGNSRRQ